jgi:ankyrin repeat protein/superfamily II DNA or RNA helicase
VGGVIADPEKVASEVKNFFERRFRSVKGEGWRLRYLHEVGLERFVREVLAKGECRKVVQMPTGAGKSVLMALLALATAHLRGCVREGDRRNVMLVLAPLNRIKLQLIEPLVIVSGVRSRFQLPPNFTVGILSSEKRMLSRLRKELFKKKIVRHGDLIEPPPYAAEESSALWVTKYKLTAAESVDEALLQLRDLVESKGSNHCFVVALCPHVLKEKSAASHETLLKYLDLPGDYQAMQPDDEILKFLKERTLALFVDEAHVMINGKLGEVIGEFAKRAPIALGFTATPVKETFSTITGGTCPQHLKHDGPYACDLLLYGEPIFSNDLILGKGKWVQQSDDKILVNNLVAHFYRSHIKLDERVNYNDGDAKWKGVYSRERVEEYAKRVFEVLEEHFGSDASRAKVLILAPNTGEADEWGDVLRTRGVKKVFVAHSNMSDPLGAISEFVNSESGFLVAVDMVKLGFDDPDLDALVIARPLRSIVAYVQMRGRVLRYPKSEDRPKAKHGALILHLAADEVLEKDYLVREAEAGKFSSAYGKVEKDLSGFAGEAIKVEMRVETERIASVAVGLGGELLEPSRELFEACERGDVELVEVLLDEGANPNVKDERGWTPLHYVALSGVEKIAMLLVSRKAEVNAKDNEGKTPLHYAAENHQTSIVDVLVSAGADPNIKDNLGRTPLHYAVLALQNVKDYDTRVIRALLGAAADPNARDDEGRTPLHYAAALNWLSAIDVLHEHGADVNAQDKQGRTPLHIAVMEGNVYAAIVLLGCKADPNARDAEGRTPLHYAVQRGDLRIVERLVKARADVNAQDNLGVTPLDLARKSGYQQIAELLAKAAGAREEPSPPTQREEVGARERLEVSQGAGIEEVPLVLETGVWDKKRGRPLLRIKVDTGKHTREEICVLYLYPKEKMVHVSWRDGRQAKCAVGEELDRELAEHLGKHVKGMDAGKLIQFLKVVDEQLKSAARRKRKDEKRQRAQSRKR